MDKARDAIHFVACGAVSELDLDLLALRAGTLLSVQASVLPPIALPASAYNPQRDQYNAGMLVSHLAGLFPDCLRVIGITARDLFLPIFTHVYGEAQMSGKAAIVSFFRLGFDCPDNNAKFTRTLKIAIHELLHTFDLTHCHDPECLMWPVTKVDHLDFLPLTLCRSCRNFWEHSRGTYAQGDT